MSTYEHFNNQVDKRERRRRAGRVRRWLVRMIRALLPVLVWLLLVAVLMAAGCISRGFALALAVAAVAVGGFRVGKACL